MLQEAPQAPRHREGSGTRVRPICFRILAGHNPSTPHPPGHPFAVRSGSERATRKAGQVNMNYGGLPTVWASAQRPDQRHLHLHVPMHVCGQGGPVKDEVIHHHVQGQPWSPVRHGFIQGTCWPLLSLDLPLHVKADLVGKDQGWGGRGRGALRQQGAGTFISEQPTSREHNQKQGQRGTGGPTLPAPRLSYPHFLLATDAKGVLFRTMGSWISPPPVSGPCLEPGSREGQASGTSAGGAGAESPALCKEAEGRCF